MRWAVASPMPLACSMRRAGQGAGGSRSVEGPCPAGGGSGGVPGTQTEGVPCLSPDLVGPNDFIEHALRSLKNAVQICDEGISTSRTCEIGLSRHGEIDYHGLVYLVDRVTRRKTASQPL